MKNRNTSGNGKDKPNYSMTACSRTGIKIKDSGNQYKYDPFANINPFKDTIRVQDREDIAYSEKQYEALDLNVDNYSREELYRLFGFRTSAVLTEENMKEAKKVVLKTHPDKSRLDNKYFVFFGKAYKKLQEIYEFQNKVNSKKTAGNSLDNYGKENTEILDKMFDMKKDLKDTGNFNKWFNEQFEKHRLEDPVEAGYGNWLKSDDDIIYTPQNINKDSMGVEMEKRKKELQQLTPYTGVGSYFSNSSAGGASLMEYGSNFTSGSLFSGDGLGYTDLRQAYVESVIPVTQEDFNKVDKFKSIDEYKRHRDTANITPLSKEEAMRQLLVQEGKDNQDSAALAFYYAQQSEKAKQNNDQFWAGLKQITNW